VIEAGDLKRTAPLRTLCERARNAAAIACYADNERDLARLVDQELRAAGLSLTSDARDALVPLLGGDRRASLAEIRKLALYAHGQDSIGLDDVLAIVADASSLALDQAVDAAFAGRPTDTETELAKARVAGTAASTVLTTAMRQVTQLHKARLAIESGASLDQAMGDARPPVHFSRKRLVETALKAWTAKRLERVMAYLAEAVLDTRRQPSLGEAIAHRAIMRVADAARRRSA
jgi:DNA polymerase III subunit delta